MSFCRSNVSRSWSRLRGMKLKRRLRRFLRGALGICFRRFLNRISYAKAQRRMQFPNGWLAFELGVLRRLKFASVALPFTGEPELSVQLKNWRVRVAANDPMLWSYTKSLALVENNTEKLNEDDLDVLLDDAYVPRDKMSNSALLKWFNETDAWWF